MASEDTADFERVLLIAAPTREVLLEKLAAGISSINLRSVFRLAIVDPTPERLAKAKEFVLKGRDCRGLQGIWYVGTGLLRDGGKLAFGFPGIDSSAKVSIDEVAKYFNLALPKTTDVESLENRGIDVFHTSDLYTKLLRKIGIVPQAIFGHSLGEWSGIVASGLTPENTVDEVIAKLQPGMLPVPGVIFAAVGCGVEKAREAIKDLPRIQISHDNCPHQSIICGVDESIDKAVAWLSHEKVMCQKLDFRSGFHTELFRPFLGPLRESIETMSFSKPTTPLWSATTCRPFPANESEIRALLVRHLLETVRFRELTEALYADGFRVFAQVGSGSLPGFIDDTLRGRPHLAISTVVPNKSAMFQFRRFCLGLFAEGADFDLEFLLQNSAMPVAGSTRATSVAAPAAAVGVPSELAESSLFRDLQNSFATIQRATQDIIDAFKTEKPFTKKITKHLSLINHPELMDHTFYKQQKGWKNVNDLFPVMPMTGSIDLVMRMAREMFPELKVVAVENIAATKWVAVDVPADFEFTVEFDGRDRIKFNMVGHFAATVLVKKNFPAPPVREQPALVKPRATRVKAEDIYNDGWLFHGPRFQCIKQLAAVGENGLEGVLRANDVPGALLDNAGQLAGYLIMESLDIDRYAMPIKIARIEFFAEQPTAGDVECGVRFDRIRSRDIMMNMELTYRGKVWARITGWEKWRFETDAKLWDFLIQPGKTLLSEQKDGYSSFARPEISSASCDDLSRRYLREEERKVYNGLGKKKEAWICGRVAAKDAIRNYLWQSGYKGNIFPAEIYIDNDANGRPFVKEMPGDKHVYISISHTRGFGIACVNESPGIGIDVERIETRGDGFESVAFNSKEIEMLPIASRSEWITRSWGAKEAYAKSTGLGLKGDPKSVRITELGSDRIKVEDKWITTKRIGDYIISQTESK